MIFRLKFIPLLSVALAAALFFPAQAEAKIRDRDKDGIPNFKDKDIDGDKIRNGKDPDVDGDGVKNGKDSDIDDDGIKNGKDPDVDGDGIKNGIDPDVDGDGILNGNDPDIDGDGFKNSKDSDMDGDGIKNNKDSDIDGDGKTNKKDSDPTALTGTFPTFTGTLTPNNSSSSTFTSSGTLILSGSASASGVIPNLGGGVILVSSNLTGSGVLFVATFKNFLTTSLLPTPVSNGLQFKNFVFSGSSVISIVNGSLTASSTPSDKPYTATLTTGDSLTFRSNSQSFRVATDLDAVTYAIERDGLGLAVSVTISNPSETLLDNIDNTAYSIGLSLDGAPYDVVDRAIFTDELTGETELLLTLVPAESILPPAPPEITPGDDTETDGALDDFEELFDGELPSP